MKKIRKSNVTIKCNHLPSMSMLHNLFSLTAHLTTFQNFAAHLDH